MAAPIYDTKGRQLTAAELLRAMLMINLAGGFSNICVTLAHPGSNTLTVFINEWLSASASSVGAVLMLAGFLPLAQPIIAQIVQRIKHRKRFILCLYSTAYCGVFIIAAVPWLGRSQSALQSGLVFTTAGVLIMTFATQIVTLVMWTWMGDIVPEYKRSWFFGQGQCIANIAGAVGLIIPSIAIDHLGGTRNPYVMSGTFAFAGAMGLIAVYLLSRVPDVPTAAVKSENIGNLLSMIVEPITNRSFLMLLIAIAAVAFSMTLTNPFTILYGRAATVGGHNPGLEATLQYWSVISAIVGFVGIFSGPFWGWLGDRLGPKFIMACGCLALSWYWLFFIATPHNYRWLLAFGMAVFGWFFPAYNIGWSTCAFNISPRQNRAAYLAVIPFAMMAGGPAAMLGGYLADKFSVADFLLPAGIPFAYIHLLTILTTIGICIAICLICLIPMPGQKRLRDALPFVLDLRFLPNIIRAQILAHTSNPALFVRALDGLNGKSAQIAIKEIQDKLADACPAVRKAAFNAITRISPNLAGQENSEPFAIQQFWADCSNTKVWIQAYNSGTLGKAVEQACRKDNTNAFEILELYARTKTPALCREIALGLADGLQNNRKFYKILTRETVVPGSYFGKLTACLRKTAQKLPIARQNAEEIISKIEEDFHAADYPAVLQDCCDLNKTMELSANTKTSILPQITAKLCSIANSREQKEQAITEMLLGLFLTAQQFDNNNYKR
jgi:MFS family permease